MLATKNVSKKPATFSRIAYDQNSSTIKDTLISGMEITVPEGNLEQLYEQELTRKGWVQQSRIPEWHMRKPNYARKWSDTFTNFTIEAFESKIIR